MATVDRRSQADPASGGRPPRALRGRRRRPRRLFRAIDQNYNDVVVAIIALVTVLAGLVGYLESWADNHYATNVRESQVLAVGALGHDMGSRQRESYDFFLYTTWNEWDWRRIRAGAEDPAEVRRADQIQEMIVPLTPLLDGDRPYYDPETGYSDLVAYHADINLVTTTLLLEQRAVAIESASAWNSKSDGYVTILTVLAVALFLYGLSTTVRTNLRYLFSLVGTFLVGLALVWAAFLTIGPVPDVPSEAISAYAQGTGLLYVGRYAEAQEAFDNALYAFPHYANAYEGKAEIHLAQGEYAKAARAYERAIHYGSDDAGAYWNMGWCYYLAGDYDAAQEASRQALKVDPDLLPVRMNVGTILLAKGETRAAMREYERGLRLAVDPNAAIPASWSHLYLRATVLDLERLVDALDGYTDFYQAPDVSQIQDPVAVRADAETALRYIEEGVVAIETMGSPLPGPTEASLSPIVFARYVGPTGELLGQSETFSRGLMSVVAACSFEDLPRGAILSRRVIRLDWSGVVEYLPTMGEDLVWDGEPSGTLRHEMQSPWPGNRGMLPGIYTVEYYVDGNQLQTASFAIPDEDTPVVGPLVFALETSGGGVAYNPAGLFPAGVATVRGLFNYSGLPADTLVHGWWYRNDQLYERDSSFRSTWGSESYSISDVPPGDYRLDLFLEGEEEVLQSATFRVVDIDSYLQAIGAEPADARFHQSLGDAYAYWGDYDLAAARYQRATELDPDCAECFYQWWSILYSQGEYGAAVEKLQRAIDLRPLEYSYLCDLGKTYYRAGDDESASAAYRQAVPAAPAYAYNAWGNAFYVLGRYEESVVKYGQAIELRPDAAVYHANLAGAYIGLEEYDLAIAALEDAVTVDPEYAWAYNKWGSLLYDQGFYAEAAEEFEWAVALEPGDAEYHANLANAYRELGENDLAAREYEQAVSLDPGDDASYNRWGNILYAEGEYLEAAEKYLAAVEIDPFDAVYHANLATAYRKLGEYEWAVAEYEQAVALDPDYASAYNGWGNALYALERYAEAAEKYEMAIELAPDEAVYHYNLGLAYGQLGQNQQAITALERAAELAALEGDADLLQDAQDKLAEIRSQG